MPPRERALFDIMKLKELDSFWKSVQQDTEKEPPRAQFDISTLPVPKPKAKLPPGIPKAEGPNTRSHFKRAMMRRIGNLSNQSLTQGLSEKDKAAIRKENEYQNFLDRMLFKFSSIGGMKSNENFGDPRNTTDYENYNKYRNIWNSLSPTEKDRVIAASGKPHYQLPVNLSRYLPKLPKAVAPKTQADREAKRHLIDRLENEKNKIENTISYPERWSKYEKNPGGVPTKEQAEELRREFYRDVFKRRTLFRLDRGEGSKADKDYISREFSSLWDVMSPKEKDEYITQAKGSMSEELFKKRYGIPSLISQLPEPKKPAVSGAKKTGPGSRAFEKEKMLSDIKSGDEALRNRILEKKLSKEQAEPLIKKQEYENFLKRQQFKFSDPSLQTALSNRPFDYNKEHRRVTRELGTKKLYFTPENLRRGSGIVKPGYPETLDILNRSFTPDEYFEQYYNPTDPRMQDHPLHNFWVNFGQEAESEIGKEREKHAALVKDPRAREDVAGASQYANIWNRLTPAEKNQVMEAASYKPKGFDYYLTPPSEAQPTPQAAVQPIAPPVVEQKVAQEVAPPLFPSPLSREQQIAERDRLKAEKAHLKQWKSMWESLTPVEKQQLITADQLKSSIDAQKMGQYVNIARQYGVPMQYESGMGLPPAMMSELMQGPQTRYIPVKPRKSISEKVMSSFDPNLFNPEYLPEEF